MKILLKTALTIVILGSLGAASAAYASVGDPPAAQGRDCVELVPPIPENEIPQIAPVGVFLEREATLNVPSGPGWRLMLAVDCVGNPGLKVDDQAAVRNLITGQEWSWDFRSADRQAIVPLNEAVDLTFLINPGAPTISLLLTLIDVSPPVHSSSSFVVYWVYDPAAVEATPEIPTLEAEVIPPTPVLLPTAAPAPTKMPTPVPTVSVMVAVETVPAESLSKDISPPAWLVMTAILIAGSMAIGVVVWLANHRHLFPFGEIEIYLDGRYLERLNQPIDLADFNQPVVRAGVAAECHIPLTGENVPPVLCQFRAEHNELGQVETVVDILDPERQEVVETKRLRSGDRISIHPFTVVYTNYAEQDVIMFEGEYNV